MIKRTCAGCKALTYTNRLYCSLGYQTTDKKELYGTIVEIKPTEECPKPKTYSEYINVLEALK